ncbi:response regulator transcription factor [Solidesulfovibrio sp.]
MRVLIVEDEPAMIEALRAGLGQEGFTVVAAATGEEGFFLVNEQVFDVVLLDIVLPGRDGLHILETLRRRGLDTPVIMLTGKDRIEDRVRGLDAGADDYLVKPFALAELLARIRALLRRGRLDKPLRLACGDLVMDLANRVVTRADRTIALTLREFDLLEYLLRHAGRIVSRDMIAADVWLERNRSTPLDNVIDVHIARIRRKLEHGRSRKLLHTVRGVGFTLKEEEDAPRP